MDIVYTLNAEPPHACVPAQLLYVIAHLTRLQAHAKAVLINTNLAQFMCGVTYQILLKIQLIILTRTAN